MDQVQLTLCRTELCWTTKCSFDTAMNFQTTILVLHVGIPIARTCGC